jgi:uracil phosphoribosyltransferase
MVVHVCEQTNWLRIVLTKLRDVNTGRAEFRKYAKFIGELLVTEAVNKGFVPLADDHKVVTPTGATVNGTKLRDVSTLVAVSIVRAGNAFVDSVLRLIGEDVQMGQLVIQRDERTALPIRLLEKLPSRIKEAICVLVLDPMLATGGSIISAIEILLSHGVEESKIILLHALGCPEGLAVLQQRFPKVNVVLGVADSHLNERKFIMPGLGDFGDRFYCD